MLREPVLSRHRLPHFYRVSLTLVWMMPLCIFVIAILGSRGATMALGDPRFLLCAGIMCVPAFCVWREGIDVMPSGIVARIHLPRYYSYEQMETWYCDYRSNKRVLTVWDANGFKLWECRTGHLTDLPKLLSALKRNVRYRNWPV